MVATLDNFRHCSDFLDKEGKHIEQHKVEEFRGSLAFSSANALAFGSTSRADDIVSLSYFLIYLSQGYLDFLTLEQKPLRTDLME